MSFDRPGAEPPEPVSDSDVNEALENNELDRHGLDAGSVEHEEGQPSPGPEPTEERRTPDNEDVTTGNEGRPVEPPD